MSDAFDRGMAEFDRVWDASERFDTKVLQFVGFVSAAALAGAALLATVATKTNDSTPLLTQLPAGLIRFGWLLLAGSVTFGVAFFILAIQATLVGETFKAPVDPRLLAKNPTLLKDDETFQQSALSALGIAFGATVNAMERKRKRLKWALVCLLFAMGFVALPFAAAFFFVALHCNS